MRVLLLHNRYKFRGGEEVCVEAHQTLLVEHGHTVKVLEATNDGLHGMAAEWKVALSAVYSLAWKNRVSGEIAGFRPDVVHVHNSFPLMSPAVIFAAKSARVPVVQTLHNYRLLCPNALLYRNGHVCEDCVGAPFPWRGVVHKCYRNSALSTAAVGFTYSVHRTIGTYRRVDAIIALTQFARSKFIAGGIPESSITVVPNWLEHDPGIGPGDGNYVLYAGRLSEEKGVPLLLEAWRRFTPQIELKIAGNGPLMNHVTGAQERVSAITYLGQQSRAELYSLIRGAKALVVPSACYEGLPRVLVESFAAGTPVIASKLGSLESLVQQGINGLHFRPGDAEDLIRQLDWLVKNPEAAGAMRSAARATYEAKYTAEHGYEMLMAVYERVLRQPRQKAAVR
jgi:glycosyltransferase involved in cell wall biosynthesis